MTCPFHTPEGRCGLPVSFYDKAKTVVVCPKGHRADVQQLPGGPGPEVAPTRRRVPPSLKKTPVRDVAVLALIADAFVRHL